MSPILDLPIAAAIWIIGFLWLGRTGSWTLLAVMAIAGALRLVLGDRQTRDLLVPRVAALVVGLAAGVAMAVTTLLLERPLAAVWPAFTPETHRLYAMLRGSGHEGPPLVGLILIMSASEEILFRGRVLGPPARGPGWPASQDWSRIAYSTAIYGAAHAASGSLMLLLVALLCGAAWALVRVLARNLWGSILTHALWDLAILIVFPAA
jgi:membrane protease YdiL (CAAX protease family)